MEHVQVLITGGGIGGLSAAIWCQRLGLSCLLVEKADHIGGQLLHIRNEIVDFPPRVYPHGYDLLEDLKLHPAIQTLHPRLEEAVISIDPLTHIVTTTKNSYQADFVIVATGVSANVIPALEGCSRVLSTEFSTTAQAPFITGQDIAVIGGGDRALESSANLSKFANRVDLLVRSHHLRARTQWTTRLEELPNLQVFWETQIDTYEVRDEKIALKLRSVGSGQPYEIVVDWILPRIGVHGNSDSFPSLATFGDGYLQTDDFQRTSPEWIYALGDVSNGASYASLSLAVGQAMKAVKHISLQIQHP
ncbi:NAD(P)/FAD-dependent oxidoreductase [Brevibacillus choshinensis]|uniref:NAD(P)/FAD-dependent oxidoreductase n=1 Tax=Brevibacillus choshinensis TaxID=54911 RepID=UPI002E1CCD4B|nr:NAD(P)/FAD-dependent oxidoreductase [Brevibacillus choshinensis]